MRTKLVLALVLVLVLLGGLAYGINARRPAARFLANDPPTATKIGDQRVAAPDIDRDKHSFEVGKKLGEAFARDCSIFVGVVSTFDKPGANENYTAKIQDQGQMRIIPSEWLWKKPQSSSASALEDFGLNKFKPLLTTPGLDTDGLQAQVGDQLLVVDCPVKGKPDGGDGDKYALALKDEALSLQIRATVSRHDVYSKSPADIAGALENLNDSQDLVFCGYLVRYLWRAAKPENFNNESMVLSKLLLNPRIPASDLAIIRMTLTRMLLASDFPLSAASRNFVIGNLIRAGSGKNILVARQAIPMLLVLTESEEFDLNPFLNAGSHKTLAANYQSLLATGYIQGKHSAFESQLGISKPN